MKALGIHLDLVGPCSVSAGQGAGQSHSPRPISSLPSLFSAVLLQGRPRQDVSASSDRTLCLWGGRLAPWPSSAPVSPALLLERGWHVARMRRQWWTAASGRHRCSRPTVLGQHRPSLEPQALVFEPPSRPQDPLRNSVPGRPRAVSHHRESSGPWRVYFPSPLPFPSACHSSSWLFKAQMSPQGGWLVIVWSPSSEPHAARSHATHVRNDLVQALQFYRGAGQSPEAASALHGHTAHQRPAQESRCPAPSRHGPHVHSGDPAYTPRVSYVLCPPWRWTHSPSWAGSEGCPEPTWHPWGGQGLVHHFLPKHLLKLWGPCEVRLQHRWVVTPSGRRLRKVSMETAQALVSIVTLAGGYTASYMCQLNISNHSLLQARPGPNTGIAF